MLDSTQRVVVIGGGLAGLAAATSLAQSGYHVRLFEARNLLGGRASSFVDSQSGETIDNCQHVGMGCCTNLQHFCETHAIDDGFRREDTLYFFDKNGSCSLFRGTRWLPAPLHLGPALLGLKYLSWREKIQIALAMLRLLRVSQTQLNSPLTMQDWLSQQRQSGNAINCFWNVIFVSALSETLDRISLAVGRKVIVDGLMAHPQSYVVEIPEQPLGELYGEKLQNSLEELGVSVQFRKRLKALRGDASQIHELEFSDERITDFDTVVLALPWKQVFRLLDPTLQQALPELEIASQFPHAAISSVHLWFDRPITQLPHAVFVDHVSQWLFARGTSANCDAQHTKPTKESYYYQVVISASDSYLQGNQQDAVAKVCTELTSVFPEIGRAKLVHSRCVSEKSAVFSPTWETEQQRPSQATSVRNLFLAGDWTQTGWPATMEGAVRSGYLAAEAICKQHTNERRFMVDDLPKSWLMRLLMLGKDH